MKPFNDVLRVGDASAQHQQLGMRRSHRNRDLIIQPTVFVPEHLVFIDDEKTWPLTTNQSPLLGLEGGDDNRRVEVLREIACGDTNVPASRAPLGQLIIRQS